MKLEHVGIVVKNLEKSLNSYKELLGVSDTDIETEDYYADGHGASLAFLPFGDAFLELIHPKQEVDFMRDRDGDLLNHIAIEVDDIEAFYEKMKSKGVALLEGGIREGSRGTKVFFFQPEVFNGIFVEIVEKPKR